MTTEQTAKPTTALTLPQRAAVALGSAETEKKLTLLVKESKTITEIKNGDGREQCHTAYMKLKNTRVAIEKTGKAARDDATKFSKAVIEEEHRLVGLISDEEDRLQKIRDAWDERIEAERQAKIEAERQRIADIQTRINDMRNAPLKAVGMPSAAIRHAAQLVADIVIDEQFAEFRDQAMTVRSDAFNKLEAAALAAEKQEAEAARLKEEREELARLRQEAEARRIENDRKVAEERAAQEARIAQQQAEFEAKRNAELAALEESRRQAEREAAEQRAKQEAELAQQRAELARQQAERDAEAAMQAKEAREAQEAAQALIAAEQERLRMERAAFEREQAEIAEAKRVQEEADRIAMEHTRLTEIAETFLNEAKQKKEAVEWAYSFNEEAYHGEEPTIEAAIAEALAEFDNNPEEHSDYFWVGQCKRFYAKGDADLVIDYLQECAYEECGEYAETYLDDVTDAERKELSDFITAWAARVDRSNFYTIEKAQKITVEAARRQLQETA